MACGKKITRPIIGAHVGASGGVSRAVENAVAIGAECIQIFGASPRQWRVKPPSDEEVEKFKKTREKAGISPIYLHAAYLVNLASAESGLLKKSIDNLAAHLSIAERLGAEGLVFHVGSGKGIDKEKALTQEIRAIRQILKIVKGKARLFMENTAGGGAKIGSIPDLSRIFYGVDSERVGICFDTAHAFQAGFLDKYDKNSVEELFDEWDKAVGLKNIGVLHINDSKTAAGSHNDRHENIGEGQIGISGFQALAGDPRLWTVPWILEVPGYDGGGPDKKNIKTLLSLFS